jgi:hypothetical protein
VIRGGFGSAFRRRDSRTVFVIVVVSKRPCDEPESYELRKCVSVRGGVSSVLMNESEKIRRE